MKIDLFITFKQEVVMKKRKNVLCIDSDFSFINCQEKELRHKNLEKYFFPFSNFWDALHFIEKHIIANNDKLHYILLDEESMGKQLISSLEKISGLKNYLKKPEIIFYTANNSDVLRNRVMQHPFVSAFLVKPIPHNYIEFLITGQYS